MSDFVDREMLRQLKNMNTHLKHISKSLDYLEHCFKPIRGKYKLEVKQNDISKETFEVQDSESSL